MVKVAVMAPGVAVGIAGVFVDEHRAILLGLGALILVGALLVSDV